MAVMFVGLCKFSGRPRPLRRTIPIRYHSSNRRTGRKGPRDGGNQEGAPRTAAPAQGGGRVKGIRRFALASVLLSLPVAQGRTTASDSGNPPATGEGVATGGVPLWFEENRGQADPAVSHVARARGYTVHLSGRDAYLMPSGGGPGLRMETLGSSGVVRVAGTGVLGGKSHYFKGSDPSGWIRGVRQFRGVRVAGSAPGVSVDWLGAGTLARFDLRLEPGVDASRALLRFEGADRIRLDPDGALAISLAGGAFRFTAPRAHQEGPGGKRPVECRFVALARAEVGFVVEGRDPGARLVIDPEITWATLAGGTGQEPRFSSSGNCLAPAGSGAVFLATATDSTDFPVTEGAFQTALSGTVDALVLKVADGGGSLLWATYLGGSTSNDSDVAYGVAAGPGGTAVVSGSTRSTDFPVTPGAYDESYNGFEDLFVTRLASDGGSLVFSTYLGSGGRELVSTCPVAVAGDGTVWVAGRTLATTYPTTAGAYQLNLGEGNGADAVLSRLSADGSTLLYSTYFGGPSTEHILDLELDSSDNPIVCGEVDGGGTGFPLVEAAFDGTDIPDDYTLMVGFVTWFDGTGAPVFSTLLPGTQRVGGIGQYGGDKDVYATGWAGAQVGAQVPGGDFPATAGAYQETLRGESDGFVARFSDNGALEFATLFGGTGPDHATQIFVDAAGGAIVAGTTASVDFPTLGAFQVLPSDPTGSFSDAFLVRVNNNGSGLTYSTYFGDGWEMGPRGLLWDPSGDVFLAGATAFIPGATWSPATAGAFQTVAAGGNEIFVARITPAAGEPPADTVDLSLLKGTAGDSAKPGKDKVSVSGTFAFNGGAADPAFDSMEDTLVLVFGRGEFPLGVRARSGTPEGPGVGGWTSKNGKHTWKSGKGTLPKVKIVVDTVKGTWSASLSGLDLPAALDEDIFVRVLLGRERGTSEETWVENPKKPGSFGFKAP